MEKTRGIHHITAIVGHPQENMDFYGKILGLRFIKKTVNFDDPETYHFYFGDEKANPGTIITFFPWANARKGRIGDGQVGTVTFIIPKGSMEFWKDRLASYGIESNTNLRLEEQYLQFEDYHGLRIELVEKDIDHVNNWEVFGITQNEAILGFAGGILLSSNPEETIKLLEDIFGYRRVKEDEEYIRLETSFELGNYLDVKLTSSGKGINSVGTIHHIAMRAKDDKEQLKWQIIIRNKGYEVTNVRDRNYFKSIYFRDKGGILFEIATDGPGFNIDEDLKDLGKSLKLPKQYEEIREKLESILIPVSLEE